MSDSAPDVPRPSALPGSAGAPRPRVVAFDVDETLTTRDCVLPFLRTVDGTADLGMRLAARARTLVPALIRRDRDTMKAIATEAVFTGRRVDEVEAAGRSFALRILGEWIRPDALAALSAHHDAGATVVLVSASYAVYLRPLCEHLPIDHVIGTEIESNGVIYSGRLVDGNCRGEEKRRRLHAWLAAEHGGRAAVDLWAYGDSAGDAAMLADADNAVWVTKEAVARP